MEIVNGGSGLSLSYNGVTEFVAYNSIKTISPLQLRGDFYIVLHFTTEIVDSLKINLAKVTNQPTWTNDVVGIQTAVDDIINWIGLSGGGVQVDWNVVEDTGTTISFFRRTIYNSPTMPATGNITYTLIAGSKIGVVQKLYHNHSTAPTFPAGTVLVTGNYVTSTLNIIELEWVSGTRVEIRIAQG